MLKRTLHLMALVLVGLLVIGCSDTDTIDTPPVPTTIPTPFPGFTFPLIDQDNFLLPVPNNILRNPATGLISVPIPDTASPALQATFEALNSINGFSTSGSIIVPFRGTVVEESVTSDTFLVYNAATEQQVPVTFDFSTSASGSIIIATPIIALEEETTYVVVLTDGIISGLSGTSILADNTINLLKRRTPVVDGNGNSLISQLTDEEAQSAEVTRQLSQPGFELAENLTGLTRENFPYSFAFTTQSLFDALPAARDVVTTADQGLVNANPAFLGGNAAAEFAPVAMGHDASPGGFAAEAPGPTTPPPFNDETPGNGQNADFSPVFIPTVERFLAQNLQPGIPSDQIGRIHLFSLQVPTFRNDPAQGFWSNPLAQVGTKTVNGVVYLPNSAAFPEVLQGAAGMLNLPDTVNQPVPVVIFQHGITGNKFQSAALANAVCAPPPNGLGSALIAIDLELHGDLSEPVASNDSAVSGQGFINIPNLRNSRDNVRQSVVNLYALTHAITSGQTNLDAPAGANMVVPNSETPELGAPNVNAAFPNPGYISLSLGSIVGDVFHATEPNISVSVLNVGGARIGNLLRTSPTFGPSVIQGLADAGIPQDSPLFGLFFLAAQTVVDDADPVNYADQATSGALRGGTPATILQQVNVSDSVVPPATQYDMARQHANGNAAFSQVDALASQAPLIPQVSSPFEGIGMYEIPNATHGALLQPVVDPGPPPITNPTAQIVGQALVYIGGGFQGMATITDTGIRARSVNGAVAETAEDLANYANAITNF